MLSCYREALLSMPTKQGRCLAGSTKPCSGTTRRMAGQPPRPLSPQHWRRSKCDLASGEPSRQRPGFQLHDHLGAQRRCFFFYPLQHRVRQEHRDARLTGARARPLRSGQPPSRKRRRPCARCGRPRRRRSAAVGSHGHRRGRRRDLVGAHERKLLLRPVERLANGFQRDKLLVLRAGVSSAGRDACMLYSPRHRDCGHLAHAVPPRALLAGPLRSPEALRRAPRGLRSGAA